MLCASSAAQAQPGPLDTAPDSPPDLRAELGDCPAELLRRAWTELLPLEAEVVEREVIALCTQRSEAITRFLEAQATLDGAVGVLRPPSPSVETGPPVDAVPGLASDRVERLREEVAGLRDRIARLEGEPERPETAATLSDLRDDLAAAQADLARIEGAAGDEDAAVAASAVPPPSMAPTDTVAAEAAPLAPPGAEPAGAAPALAAEAVPADPRTGPTEWLVIHAVRAEGGPWRVRLQASREITFPVPVPAVAEGGGGTASGAEPRWRTVVESDPPFTATVGQTLPDGMVLRGVTPEGVEIGDPADPDADPVTVLFGTGDHFAPGAADWDFVFLGEDGWSATPP